MGERVSVRDGILPIIIVVSHGADEPYIDTIAEVIADKIDCYAVINRGWERADKVDIANDKANCNNIAHCKEDVVKDEFLDPLLRYAYRCQKTIIAAGNVLSRFLLNPVVLHIHGCGDDIRTVAKNNKLDFILGTGLGKPDRNTCQLWRKNALAWTLLQKGVNAWEGKAGGRFAAWGKDNLNQLFHHPGYQGLAESIQIEIVRSPWRESETRAKATGSILADVLKELIKLPDFTQFNGDLGIGQC